MGLQINCPCCGQTFPVEAGFSDAEGKQLAAQFAEMEPRLGRAVLAYLRLFSSGKQKIRMSKSIRLIEELTELVKSGRVSNDGRSGDPKPAATAHWVAGIEQMLGQRDKLLLPLKNHNYLRQVVFGLATEQPNLSNRSAVKHSNQDHQERLAKIYQIRNDELIGLIKPEEARLKIRALEEGL